MNILLLQLKRIGDFILTTPAIAALRKHLPEARLTLVTSPVCEELLPALPPLDRVLPMRAKVGEISEWFASSGTNYEYCIDFTRNDRSALLSLLSCARKRITADHQNLRKKIRSLIYNQLVDCPVRLMHTVDYHLGFLTPLGISEASPKVPFTLPESALEKADQLCREKIGEEFLVVHPGSARENKFWEADRWAEVINHFAGGRALKCVVTGGSSSQERDHIAKIKSLTRCDVIDLSRQLDLLTLAALIQKSRLLATIDSAPMHLAGAMRIPQVALFGPTNPFHWRPRSSPVVILRGGTQGPVTDFSPYQTAVPMNEISTTQVIDGMESLLSAPAEPAL